MILILSPITEKTTNDIIDIFQFNKNSFKRITEKEKTIFINNKAQINNILYKDILSLWVRKGLFFYNIDKKIAKDPTVDLYFHQEFTNFIEFTVHQLEQKPHIGNYFQRVPNKLWHLEIAQQAGLCIPAMLVTTQKKEAISFKKEHSSIINKSIKDSFTGTFAGSYYYNHTERVSDEILEELDEEFFPTLFQEEIPKAYELRVIFVHEKMWAGTIMSQSDPKTSLDWRNYNHQKPNRIVPYKLPTEIEEKIRKFTQLAGLNTGAIDMIMSKDKRYVFLECNPNGQISMVSEKCNYPIEKYIADFLANA